MVPQVARPWSTWQMTTSNLNSLSTVHVQFLTRIVTWTYQNMPVIPWAAWSLYVIFKSNTMHIVIIHVQCDQNTRHCLKGIWSRKGCNCCTRWNCTDDFFITATICSSHRNESIVVRIIDQEQVLKDYLLIKLKKLLLQQFSTLLIFWNSTNKIQELVSILCTVHLNFFVYKLNRTWRLPWTNFV